MSNPSQDALLARLFKEHGAMVYRRALRILGSPDDAEEATQEVFIRAMKGYSGFESRAGVSTWLYRITTNYCLNQIRDRGRRRELWEEKVQPEARTSEAPSISVDMILMRRLLAEADERQARAAVLVFVDGMSHREAAKELDVSPRTVGNLVERFTSWAQDWIDEERSTER